MDWYEDLDAVASEGSALTHTLGSNSPTPPPLATSSGPGIMIVPLSTYPTVTESQPPTLKRPPAEFMPGHKDQIRKYLFYFRERVCPDLVAHDAPDSNPFRKLLSLSTKSGNSGALQHTLVAFSALHFALYRFLGERPLFSAKDHVSVLASRLFGNVEKPNTPSYAHTVYIDALHAKDEARRALAENQESSTPMDSEVALAIKLFLTKFDLMDLLEPSERYWQCDAKAMSKMMDSLLYTEVQDSEIGVLRDWMVADCFIYYTFGITISPSKVLIDHISHHYHAIQPAMERAERNSYYLSCPAGILHGIFDATLSASAMSRPGHFPGEYDSSVASALRNLDQLRNIDLDEWADKLIGQADMRSRRALAAATRDSAILYTLQTLPVVRSSSGVKPEELIQRIKSSLIEINPKDPYLKASVWATFIAGAQAKDFETREFFQKRLLMTFTTFPWGYIWCAIRILVQAWERGDMALARGDEAVEWLPVIRDLGRKTLIV